MLIFKAVFLVDKKIGKLDQWTAICWPAHPHEKKQNVHENLLIFFKINPPYIQEFVLILNQKLLFPPY